MRPDHYRIRVTLEPLDYADRPMGAAIGAECNFSAEVFSDAFAKLGETTRDPVLLGYGLENVRDMKIRSARAQVVPCVASRMASQIAPLFTEILRKNDTINGYPREEWEAAHQ